MLREETGSPFLSEFPTLKLLRQDGSFVPASEAFCGKKYVLVYFSAHWCPPCQRFTPILADFYKDHSERLGFEILFVSSDRKEQKMMDYFQNRCSNYVIRRKDPTPAAKQGPPVQGAYESAGSSHDPFANGGGVVVGGDGISAAHSGGMRARDSGGAPKPKRGLDRTPISDGMGNWLAVPFHETKASQSLARRFKVNSIPKLIVVTVDTGYAITKEGKAMVYRDEHAESFPWRFADDAMARQKSGELFWWQVLLIAWLLVGLLYYYYYYYYFAR